MTVYRPELDDSESGYSGFVVGVSETLVLLHAVSEHIRLDGYEAVWIEDIEEVATEGSRLEFYGEAITLKRQQPVVPNVSLQSLQALLESAQAEFPLLVLNRERLAPDSCEVGRVKFSGPGGYSLHWITPDARWDHDDRLFRFKDLTRVGFSGEYENTLAMVAAARGTPWPPTGAPEQGPHLPEGPATDRD